MIPVSLAKPLSVLSLLCALVFLASASYAQDWRPVMPAELQSSTPVVEPKADAEAVFWEVRVDDSQASELSLRHYVRIKIFTERGREDFSRHDVTFTKGTRIKDFEARVTKPDGSASLVGDKDVLERDIVKAGGFKVRAKTIAFPGLEIGSIVEYRYREVLSDASATMRLLFQREVPIREVTYYVKPFAGDRSMGFFRFNVGDLKFEKDKNGFYKAAMQNVPAFKEEPYMLPEDEVKSWVYIYYTSELPKSADAYWKQVSENLYGVQKDTLKANDEVKKAAAEAVGDATTDDEKLRRLYTFVQTQIKNTSYAENVSEEDKKQALKNKVAADTLKYRVGAASDIDQLFGAMARSAGFDARVAFSGNRNEMFFKRDVPNLRLMLGSSSIAVKVGEKWKFFSPASFFVPYGMMSWIEEAQIALIPDQKELIFQPIPLSEAGRSVEKRTGTFKLDKDGTLTGSGRVEFSGHQSFVHKTLNRGESKAERETRLRNYLQSAMSGTVEIESFTIENADVAEKPFTYTFKVKVPGYAQRTGRRLFFQPNVFEKNAQPRFTANSRKYDVYFTYPFTESDEIRIDFPPEFKLENADAPPDLIDSQKIGSHQTKIGLGKDGTFIVYVRNFSFGNGGFIRFPAGSYSSVKSLFEAFNKADTHQMTLRAEGTTATSAQ
jgi:hypothetical protein